jgi:hypothetical protein
MCGCEIQYLRFLACVCKPVVIAIFQQSSRDFARIMNAVAIAIIASHFRCIWNAIGITINDLDCDGVAATSRDLRARTKVAWDITLAILIIPPRAHEPTLLDCDGVGVTCRDLRANPKVAWDIALAVTVVSPRAHEPTLLDCDGV